VTSTDDKKLKPTSDQATSLILVMGASRCGGRGAAGDLASFALVEVEVEVELLARWR
jgi:hypothetical protein